MFNEIKQICVLPAGGPIETDGKYDKMVCGTCTRQNPGIGGICGITWPADDNPPYYCCIGSCLECVSKPVCTTPFV